jgi:hypothetical protein
MASETHAVPGSKAMLWTGWVISALVVLGMLMSGIIKLAPPDGMEKEFKEHLGWDFSLALGLAIVEISCAVIYAFPRTAVLGAILLTGYLGGAIATHVRIHEQFIAPAVIGILLWGGLFLRDARLRALIPWRS